MNFSPMKKLATRFSWLLYDFGERLSWYIRMACVGLLVLTAIAVIASMWWHFYVLCTMAEEFLMVPRTNP